MSCSGRNVQVLQIQEEKREIIRMICLKKRPEEKLPAFFESFDPLKPRHHNDGLPSQPLAGPLPQ